jgi:ABC-type transport system involved in cytochrome c biogenesis permease subunit
VDIDPRFPYLAILTGLGSMLAWGLVLVREFWAVRYGVERRGSSWLIMPISAFLVSIGTLASAIGFAILRGVITLDIDPDTLSIVSSMGRGALLMAGLIVLTNYRPRT